MVVVLPAPLAPSRPKISPGWTRNETPLTASNVPNRLTNPSTTTMSSTCDAAALVNRVMRLAQLGTPALRRWDLAQGGGDEGHSHGRRTDPQPCRRADSHSTLGGRRCRDHLPWVKSLALVYSILLWYARALWTTLCRHRFGHAGPLRTARPSPRRLLSTLRSACSMTEEWGLSP